MENPAKIENCPIVDSAVEIRFNTSLDPNAVFGVFYNVLKDDFPNVEKLPILKVPEEVRESDSSFQYKAHFKLTDNNNKYSVQIGPNVFVIGSPIPYEGWDNYSTKINESINKIFNLNVIENVFRLGYRVINFFESNIFDKINLNLIINNQEVDHKNTIIRTQLDEVDYSNILQVANNISKEINGQNMHGSIIDIDTYKEEFNKNVLFHDFQAELEKAHKIEKNCFFNLLKQDFLKEELKPKYNE